MDINSIFQSQQLAEMAAAQAQQDMAAFQEQLQANQEENERRFQEIIDGVNEDIKILKESSIKFPPIDISIIIDAIIQKLLEMLEPYKTLILKATQLYIKYNPDLEINSKTTREAWNRYIWDPEEYNTAPEDQLIPGGLKQYIDGSIFKEQIKNEVTKLIDLYKSLIDTIKNFGLSLSTLPAVMAPFTGGGAPAAVPSMLFALLSQLSTIINMATSIMGALTYLKPPVDIFEALVTPVRTMLAPIIEIKKMIMGFLEQGLTIPAFDPEKSPVLGLNPDPTFYYLGVKDYGKIKIKGPNKVPASYLNSGVYTDIDGFNWSITASWYWNYEDTGFWAELKEYDKESGYDVNDVVTYKKIKETEAEDGTTMVEWDDGKTFWRALNVIGPIQTSEDNDIDPQFWINNWVEIDPSGPENYDKSTDYKKGARVRFTMKEYINENDNLVVDPNNIRGDDVTRIYEAKTSVPSMEYVEGNTYNAGDTVIYNNLPYKALRQTSEKPGESSDWQQLDGEGDVYVRMMFINGNFMASSSEGVWEDVTPERGYIYSPGDVVSYKKKKWFNKRSMPAIFEIEKDEDEEED